MRVKIASCASSKQCLSLRTCRKPYSLMCDLSLKVAGDVGGRGGSVLLDEHCCRRVPWTPGTRLGPARSCLVGGRKLLSALSKRASLNEVRACGFPPAPHRDHSAFFLIAFTGGLDLRCPCIQSVSSVFPLFPSIYSSGLPILSGTENVGHQRVKCLSFNSDIYGL